MSLPLQTKTTALPPSHACCSAGAGSTRLKPPNCSALVPPPDLHQRIPKILHRGGRSFYLGVLGFNPKKYLNTFCIEVGGRAAA